MKHAVRHIHFVGIGGAGMSGIAEVLQQQGYTISGSDLHSSATLTRLGELGMQVHVGHAAAQVLGADAVVTSSAVLADNPEVLEARRLHIPLVQRAGMLAELMRRQQGIAIAGTHGKTTTTCLVTSVLVEAGLDPSFVIGGRLTSASANARLGRGDFIVVEADESDASFVHLLPVMAVVTNIDADHMETYGHDFDRLKGAFVEFLRRMPFYGHAILCAEDPSLRQLASELPYRVSSYGFGADAQIRAVDVRAVGSQMHFTAQRRRSPARADLDVVLNLPGRHNVLNALAAIAIALALNIPDAAVCKALAGFQGVGRRFQSHGEVPLAGGATFTLIEDYGHHPAEIEATVEAARAAFAGRRIVLVFQPHRYTRTRDCFADFVRVLGQCDLLLLTDVYGAGEAPIAGADGRALALALRAAGRPDPVYVPDIEQMARAVLQQARAGDAVLCMGAGSVGAVPARVVALAAQEVAA